MVFLFNSPCKPPSSSASRVCRGGLTHLRVDGDVLHGGDGETQELIVNLKSCAKSLPGKGVGLFMTPLASRLALLLG